MSENLLQIYLDEYTETTPWDALKYLIAGVSYGGHVTDDWDRRLLITYINQYFCEDALNVAYFRLNAFQFIINYYCNIIGTDYRRWAPITFLGTVLFNLIWTTSLYYLTWTGRKLLDNIRTLTLHL